MALSQWILSAEPKLRNDLTQVERSATHMLLPFVYAASPLVGHGDAATAVEIGMNVIVEFVLKHGYAILFGALFAHQIGLPLPGPLFLLAAGALAAAGKLGLVASISLAVSACVLADWVWYEAGRRRGDKVLHFIHRLARDPDAHDRRAKETFARFGLLLLLLAKFVPGLDAIAPPLAGTSHTGRFRFLACDAAGAGLYSCVYTALGHIFSHDLDRAAAYAGRAGTLLAGVALAAICIYAATKLVQRYRSAGESQLLGITPADPIGCGHSVVDAAALSDSSVLAHQTAGEHASAMVRV